MRVPKSLLNWGSHMKPHNNFGKKYSRHSRFPDSRKVRVFKCGKYLGSLQSTIFRILAWNAHFRYIDKDLKLSGPTINFSCLTVKFCANSSAYLSIVRPRELGIKENLCGWKKLRFKDFERFCDALPKPGNFAVMLLFSGLLLIEHTDHDKKNRYKILNFGIGVRIYQMKTFSWSIKMCESKEKG